jgi:hypothetical protein
MAGGVHPLVSEFHTFGLDTGHEMEITDIFNGPKDEIVKKPQKADEAVYSEQAEDPGEPKFVLTKNSVDCDLDSLSPPGAEPLSQFRTAWIS